MSAHAKLSPSAASRWMKCTPSAVLESVFPNTTSSFAEEGTLAHSVSENILRERHGVITKAEYNKNFTEYKKSKYYNEEMLQHCINYADFVSEAVVDGAYLFIEQRLDMTNYVKDGFGTGDALVIKDGLLRFFDLKYGKGVPVYAAENTQLMIYGLGALNDYGHIFEVDRVELNIFQPRLDSASTWEISVADLTKWAETDLKPKADLAYDGKGDFVAGKHCGFCKAKAQCRALRDFNMGLASMAFKEPDLLSDEEIAEVLNKKAIFDNWINSVAEYAQVGALSGKIFPGWKLVHGKSNRVYADPEDVIFELTQNGFNDIYTIPALVGITELTKRLGKDTFSRLVEPLLIKPEGKPTLVPKEDKRMEICSVTEAADVFKDDQEGVI